MRFLLITALTALTVFIPFWLKYLQILFPHLRFQKTSPALPVVAGILFIISFFLPDIGWFSQTDSFQQHFVGGGMYAALLFFYFRQALGLRHYVLWQDFVLLFAWVSSLGVLSELAELTLVYLGAIHINLADTSWDLLANTLGGLLVYTIYAGTKSIKYGK